MANFSKKLKRLRKVLKKWEKDSFEKIRQKKESINKEIAYMEIKEGKQITEEEVGVLGNKRNDLNEIIYREKIMWR